MMRMAESLFELHAVDESVTIEAKASRQIDRACMETICAFANEPGLNGGYLLLGVAASPQLGLFQGRVDHRRSDPHKAGSVDPQKVSPDPLKDPHKVSPDPHKDPHKVSRDPHKDPHEVSPDPHKVDPASTADPTEEGYGSNRIRLEDLPAGVRARIEAAGRRPPMRVVRELVTALCHGRPLSARTLARLLSEREPHELTRTHLRHLVHTGAIAYTIPQMPRHPDQMYTRPEAP